MSRCENCHSEEVYPVIMRIVDDEGEPVLEQLPIKGRYCIDCGILEVTDE